MKAQTRKEQLQQLYNQICGRVPATGKEKIFVFPIEAGLGKTRTMVKALLKLHEKFPQQKSLVVTKYKDEAKRLMHKLNGLAVAINSSNKDMNRERIMQSPVVIITHSRYENLCRASVEYELDTLKRYMGGRTNLIIDEELPLMKIVHVSRVTYMAARNSISFLGHELERDFDNAFAQIKKALSKIEEESFGSHVFIANELSNDEIRLQERILQRVRKTNGDYSFYKMLREKSHIEVVEKHSELMDYLNDMQQVLHSSFCISDNQGIHCLKDHARYKLLDNNIILDASAAIQKAYDLIDVAHIVPIEHIVSHDKWRLHVWPINTSKSAKRRTFNFNTRVISKIKKICKNSNDKLLVVGNAEDVGGKQCIGNLPSRLPAGQLDNGAYVDYSNFLALLGKNNWRNFNKCLIVHTPYRPVHYYALLLKFWKPEYKLTDADLKINWSGKGSGKHYGFYYNALLDSLRESDIAVLMYQAAKRINRRNKLIANIYLATTNTFLVKNLKDNLKGIEERALIYRDTTKITNTSTSEESIYAVRLANLIKEMVKGEHVEAEREHKPGFYPKKWCAQKIGLNGTAHFSRATKQIKSRMRRLGIDQDKQNLIVKRFVEKN